MIIVDGNKPAFPFDYKENGEWKHCACRVVDIMVLSFYKGLYEDGAKLLDVLHNDRDPTLLRIDTLVPIFTWPQLQSYCIYRLNLIDGENYRVAQSKYPEEYTLPKYLVGDRGSVFSLITLAMMTPEAGTYATFNVIPTYQNDEGKIRKKRVQGHILVASTFLPDMGPDMEVHHINRHPRDNTVKNLVCLTHEEHVAAHAGLPPNTDYKDVLASNLENTCGSCLQQVYTVTLLNEGYCYFHNRKLLLAQFYSLHNENIALCTMKILLFAQ